MVLISITETTWIQSFSENVIAPIVVAAIAFFLFGKIDELRKRKSYSKLGVAILNTLIEEVQYGRNSIKDTLDPEKNDKPHPLPRKSWNGINTVPDEVLLRILEVSKKQKDIGFPSAEIRIHTKNYFDHMITNWDQVVINASLGKDFKALAKLKYSTYDEAATGVLNMLINIRQLLEENSKKWFPK
ncbi:MAG: hypothetical protein MUC78_05795 [Bacteroidales bacterium]|jgi:hypothetical protein|nr:hypothetical protein [Bacteroidales bacterium]